MAEQGMSLVLAHGAWADGSSWARVITALRAEVATVIAAPLPLTSLADDVAALNRSLDWTGRKARSFWRDMRMPVRSSPLRAPIGSKRWSMSPDLHQTRARPLQ